MSNIDRMATLVAMLNKYAHEYYTLDEPTISDKEYDALYDELLKLEEELLFVLPDSPTHRVGGVTLDGFSEYKHRLRLYSLDKSQTIDGVDAYIKRVEKACGMVPTMTVEKKFDGLTLSITYQGGTLKSAATRGDGETGEDVTEQVKTIRTVPLTIPFDGIVEVQGEGLMRLSELEKYNANPQNKPLKNARNGVAGAIRNLSPKVTKSRNLDFVAYNIGYIEGMTVNRQQDVRELLKKWGFFVDDYFGLCTNLAEIEGCLNDILDMREELDFLIDGAVIKVDDFNLREELGFTDKFPRWAIAYKYQAQETTTTLEGVEWQVSRTGKLNPIAVLTPVDLMGVTVRHATLNNIQDIAKKGVKIGDRVFIRRSNDVIPEIMGVAETYPNSVEIVAPTVCPECGSAVVQKGAFLYCDNVDNCAPRIISQLAHFASRPCMDIEGFSDKTAEAIYSQLGVKSPDQLYDLTMDDLLLLEGFKQTKAKNLLDALEKSKHTTLARFLFALGIPNIGKKTARVLEETFETLENVRNATYMELITIPDFGDIMVAGFLDFFASVDNNRLVDSLIAKGIEFAQEEVVLDGIFSGRTVVLTGALTKYKRGAAQELIKSLGGKTSDSVTKAVNLVIAGEDAGSKLDKARKLGIEIWTEEQFLAYIKD